MMRGRVAGIQLNGALKFLVGGNPVPIIVPIHERERGVCLSNRVVQCESLKCSGTRFGHGLGTTYGGAGIGAEQSVGVSEPRVSLRILRLNGDGLLEEIDSLQMALLRAFVPKIPSLQIQLVSLRIHGAVNS